MTEEKDTNTQKPKRKHSDPISLNPLDFDEALRDLLAVKPPPAKKKPPKKKPQKSE